MKIKEKATNPTWEALYWDGTRLQETPPTWFTDALYVNPGDMGFVMRFGNDLLIETRTGQQTLKPGGYIIKDGQGYLFGMTKEQFEASFEEISD